MDVAAALGHRGDDAGAGGVGEAAEFLEAVAVTALVCLPAGVAQDFNQDGSLADDAAARVFKFFHVLGLRLLGRTRFPGRPLYYRHSW